LNNFSYNLSSQSICHAGTDRKRILEMNNFQKCIRRKASLSGGLLPAILCAADKFHRALPCVGILYGSCGNVLRKDSAAHSTGVRAIARAQGQSALNQAVQNHEISFLFQTGPNDGSQQISKNRAKYGKK
jgi:hypothetical protein